MPNKSSVIKRIAVAERNRRHNKIYKSSIKTLTKKYLIEAEISNTAVNSTDISPMLNLLYSKIDKAVKKGILHKNNGARKKSFLSKVIKSI